MADRDRVTHTIYCNLGTFYSITDYYDCMVRLVGDKYVHFNEDSICWRGIKYVIDDALNQAEMYSRREVKGGATYYYH